MNTPNPEVSLFSQIASGGSTPPPAQAQSAATSPSEVDMFSQIASGKTHEQAPQGPTIGPHVSASSQLNPDTAKDPFERAGHEMTGGFARLLLDAEDKLKEVEGFTEEGRKQHPIQAHLGDIADSIHGFLFGGAQRGQHNIGTGEYGVLNNPITGAIIPGAEGEPALAGAVRGGASLLKGGMSLLKGGAAAGKVAAEGAEEGPGIIEQLRKGKAVEQEPAKAAIRKFAGADEETPILEGHKSAIDEKLSQFRQEKEAAYQAQDEAAGFDVKETRKKLKDAEYKIKQPEIDDAAKERLTKTIEESKKNLADAEKSMADKNINPKAGDIANAKWQAMRELRKGIVTYTSQDGESVKVDGLLNYLKKMRNNPKFGDRLEQIAGKDGADQFMAKLQKAKDAGAHAVKVRWIAASLPVIGGTIGEGLRIVKGVTGGSNP